MFFITLTLYLFTRHCIFFKLSNFEALADVTLHVTEITTFVFGMTENIVMKGCHQCIQNLPFVGFCNKA